ncbi:MAG: hypothetical protein WCU88_06100 [Elusimicrobiota bacterium]|jgi:hypothetical protein
MKCPACGFETPEEQGWCDFCKEPFRRRTAEPAARADLPAAPVPAAAAAAPPLPKGGPLPPAAAAQSPLSEEQISELLRQDREQIPEASPALRYVSWAFAVFIAVLCVTTTIFLIWNGRRAQQGSSMIDAEQHEGFDTMRQD